MTAPNEIDDVRIRLVAVEAAGRRLGADPNPKRNHEDAQLQAAYDVVQTAMYIGEYIREGRMSTSL